MFLFAGGFPVIIRLMRAYGTGLYQSHWFKGEFIILDMTNEDKAVISKCMDKPCMLRNGAVFTLWGYPFTMHVGMTYEVDSSDLTQYVHNSMTKKSEFKFANIAKHPMSAVEMRSFLLLACDNRLSDDGVVDRLWNTYGNKWSEALLTRHGTKKYVKLLEVLGDGDTEVGLDNLRVLFEHFCLNPCFRLVTSQFPSLSLDRRHRLATILARESEDKENEDKSWTDILSEWAACPWQLVMKFDAGVKSWQAIDRVALVDCGFDTSAQMRIMWAFIAYIRTLLSEGSDTCIPVRRLLATDFVAHYLNHYLVPDAVRLKDVERYILSKDGNWIRFKTGYLKLARRLDHIDVWTGANGTYVVVSELAEAENRIAHRMMDLGEDDRFDEEDIKESLSEYEDLTQRELDATQKAAVINAIMHKNSVIIGRPGYGKSSCISAICYVAKHLGLVRGSGPVLLTLSGKAGQRLRDEFVGTRNFYHRGYKNNDVFTVAAALHSRVEEVKNTELLIIDEASMLGTLDFGKLFCLINDMTHVVMVGDDAQLMPIEKGCVFNQLGDYTKTHPAPYVLSELGENHRLGSALGAEGVEQSLEAMRNGDVAAVWDEFDAGNIHFHGIVGDDDMSLLTDVVKMYKDRIKRCHGDISKVGLLSTTKTPMLGGLSCFALNLAVREAVNPWNKQSINLSDTSFCGTLNCCERKGTYLNISSKADDKVMRKPVSSRNPFCKGYELLTTLVASPHTAVGGSYSDGPEKRVCVGFRIGDRVMCHVPSIHGTNNGDVGTLKSINTQLGHSFASGYVVVELDRGGKVEVPLNDFMDEWQLGYAITVHKAQGSEYDDVIFCVPRQYVGHGEFLCRNMFYTAATRLRRRLDVFGDEQTSRESIGTMAAERCTLLEERMLKCNP